MIQPIQVKVDQRQKKGYTSQMSPKGINIRTLPQFLDPAHAQNIENFIISDAGRLNKRGGLEVIFTVAGTEPITMLRKFTDDIYMFAHGDKLAAYTFSTNTVTAVHTFTATGPADGVAVGEYFYVCNGSERIAYVTTGLVYALVADTNAPMATTLYAAQARLFALKNDTVYWSDTDTGVNPPFNTGTSWTAGTSATASNKGQFRNGGTARAITQLGQQMVVFYDDGKVAFRITTQESGGTLVQTTITDFQRIDFGGFRGAVYTQKGVFYVNERGLWQMVSGGVTNQPYSEQDVNISVVFGDDYFDDIDFSNGDVCYHTKLNLVLVSGAQNSSTNNVIFWYNPDTKNFGKLTGWNISRFLVDGARIFGGSATSSVMYELFSGNNGDNGSPIRAEYVQEINDGQLTMVKSLEEFFGQGLLSPSSVVTVYLDIYDRNGSYVGAKKTLTWTASGVTSSSPDGFGESSFGESGWGGTGGGVLGGLVSSFVQTKQCRINEYNRVVIRLVVNDTLPCEINWLSFLYSPKYPMRVNNIGVTPSPN